MTCPQDVAAICIESITRDDAANATFECYNSDAAKPLGEVGLSNMMKATSADGDVEKTWAIFRADLFPSVDSREACDGALRSIKKAWGEQMARKVRADLKRQNSLYLVSMAGSPPGSVTSSGLDMPACLQASPNSDKRPAPKRMAVG